MSNGIEKEKVMHPTRVHEAHKLWERLSRRVTTAAGSSWAFLAALLLTLGWLVTGPIYGYSDTWQLLMNTVSSIITFLMVFLIQRAQNKDALAMQIKLNEIIAVLKGASNRLINVEDLSEDEVRSLHQRYRLLSERARENNMITGRLSVEQTECTVDGEDY